MMGDVGEGKNMKKHSECEWLTKDNFGGSVLLCLSFTVVQFSLRLLRKGNGQTFLC